MKGQMQLRPRIISVLTLEGARRVHTMMEMYNTIFGMSPGFPAQKGSINCAKAPPKGFARLITAVAATLPRFVNHKSEYLVGAASTNGCASPVKICPNITP